MKASMLPRHEFAQRIAKVQEGMSSQDVRRMLGEPDFTVNHTYEHSDMIAWLYGNDSPNDFPTLGEVWFGGSIRIQTLTSLEVTLIDMDQVSGVIGNGGTPPDPELIPEPHLRTLLRLLDKTPEVSGWEFDPRSMISVVNTLQHLGKKIALAAIDEYFRVSSAWPFPSVTRIGEGLLMVLRALFNIPEPPGHMPLLVLGGTEVPLPADLTLAPLFPLALADDIPLLLTGSYCVGGHLPGSEGVVDYFAHHCTLRKAPLKPTDQPLEVLTQLERAPQWLCGKMYQQFYTVQTPIPEAEFGRNLIRSQLLRTVSSVWKTDLWPTAEIKSGISESGGHGWVDIKYGDNIWPQAVEAISKMQLRWDSLKSDYVRVD